MQGALKKVVGVIEIKNVSSADNKVVLMVDKDKVKLETLINTIESIEEIGEKPRYTAQLLKE